MRIRIINNFHNVDLISSLKKELDFAVYRRHYKRACTQKYCDCVTDIYREVDTIQEADMYRKDQSGNPPPEYWKMIDPYDLQYKDAGYGVKI